MGYAAFGLKNDQISPKSLKPMQVTLKRGGLPRENVSPPRAVQGSTWQ